MGRYGYNASTCNKACQKYRFFGLQNNGWCCCGNSYSTKPKYKKMPDIQCRKNRMGGGWRNAIFSVNGLHSKAPTKALSPPKYVGCYADDGHRDLKKGPMKYGYNPSTCNKACQKYRFFGLQNNGWCCCGNSYSTKPKYKKMPDIQCRKNRMGGGWRNAIFSVNGLHSKAPTKALLPPKYVGCYADDGHRDLKKGPMKYGYNLSTCNKACQKYRF